MIYKLNDKAPVFTGEYFVAPNATIIGDVAMGEMSSIWFGAVVRGDEEGISIGERSNVQDNCVVHTDKGFPIKIGDSVTIGHQVTIHGCTIGNRCQIGMKATLLNGCVIEDNCIIGAGALVTEGQHIPANSLVLGVPAKVIRTVTDEEAEKIAAHAVEYIHLFRGYSELKEVEAQEF